MLTLLIFTSPTTWITKAQAVYGVSYDAIINQYQGGAEPEDPRSELSMLWGFNPNPATVRQMAHGLNGGITWAWDDKLCSDLLPLFHEDVLCVAAACPSIPQLRAAFHSCTYVCDLSRDHILALCTALQAIS